MSEEPTCRIGREDTVYGGGKLRIFSNDSARSAVRLYKLFKLDKFPMIWVSVYSMRALDYEWCDLSDLFGLSPTTLQKWNKAIKEHLHDKR